MISILAVTKNHELLLASKKEHHFCYLPVAIMPAGIKF